MKQHQIDLFIKAFNEMDKSVSFLNNYYDSCAIAEDNYDGKIILNRLDKTVSAIEQFLLKQKLELKERKYEASFIDFTMKKIQSFMETELAIVDLNHNEIRPHLTSKVDYMVLTSSTKSILRKIDALMYESDNITMVPHGEFTQEIKNVVKLPVKKARAHLTLIKN
jgi:hypothetical protein